MRAISIDRAAPGMAVGRSLTGSNGETLLAKGAVLNERYIQRLEELGIQSLYIIDEAIGDIEVDDVISEQTRLHAKQLTREAMRDIKLGGTFNVKKVHDVVEKIIDEIMNNQNLMVCLADIRALNDYNFAHGVNVAVLSTITGLAAGYVRNKLQQLALGALFHDIGKVMLPEAIQGDQSEEFKNHTVYGFEILKKISGVSLLSAHVAFQHHERVDGSGYPRQLKAEQINEFARIVAIADAYDKMISDRPGQPRMLPQHAIEFLILNSGTYFDADMVKVFVENVALFSIGTFVLLNSGEKGVVVNVNKGFPTRPLVRIFKDAAGRPVNPPYEIDLMESHAYFLVRVLSEEDL